ncbi:MAG: RES family NAD+ phosphorylase [Methylococcales bacterium]
MAKFPEPPDISHFEGIPPEIHTIPTGETVTRIYSAGGEHPTSWNAFRFFGPTASRFDHHLNNAKGQSCDQDRGIMYLTTGDQAIPTALAEVFQETRVIDRNSNNPILTAFKTGRPIKLLDLSHTFATTIGASSVIHSGPRPRARRWAQQLYLAYPELDGIFYCSSMYGNEPAIALFERGMQAIPLKPLFHRELRDPVLANILTETADKIRYVLV